MAKQIAPYQAAVTVNNHFPDVHGAVGLERVIRRAARFKVHGLNSQRVIGRIRVTVLEVRIAQHR